MFFEKILGRLRRINSETSSPGPSARDSTRADTTSSSFRRNSNRFFRRSNTRILDDGPSSLKEVSVRKLPVEDNDDDDEIGFMSSNVPAPADHQHEYFDNDGDDLDDHTKLRHSNESEYVFHRSSFIEEVNVSLKPRKVDSVRYVQRVWLM